MRHGKKVNHLGRTAPHRKALMANMASSLIKNKRITTTVAKAKALRMYVEPLITKSKDNSVHSHRTVFAYLKDKHAVHELFTVVSEKIASRPGGYTRILKLGNRMGDNADMAMIELVDFNEFFTGFGDDKKAAGKRTRRGKAKTATTAAPKAEAKAEVVAPVVEEVAVETPAEEVAVVENTVEEVVAEAPTEETAENNDAEAPAADEEENKA